MAKGENMAKLTMSDGTIKEVTHKQATMVHKVLNGLVEPTDSQRDFCIKVVNVTFDEPKAHTSDVVVSDERISTVLDSNKSGYDKFKEVGAILKRKVIQ